MIELAAGDDVGDTGRHLFRQVQATVALCFDLLIQWYVCNVCSLSR